MQEWFKMSASYPDDICIATVDDAAEVMFVRGLAYCRRARTGGFIPGAILHTLTRSPSKAKRTVAQLTRQAPDGSPGPWEVVEGGYRVRSWSTHNDAADELEERRRSDRERQRKRRARQETDTHTDTGKTGQSRDASRDKSRDVTDPEKEKREEAAAAATREPLPPPVEILRAALEAQKLLVRWDRLTQAQIDEIAHLIEVHGDAALVRSAVTQFRPNAPASFATAWLPAWRDLRRPVGHLAAVAEECPEPGHTGTVRHCIQCASEQKAAR
ncbi:MAG: hypothetical protein CMH83_19550 [Nocardioides sp.]|nr:hypothetical protein [Nocardioides sp.]